MQRWNFCPSVHAGCGTTHPSSGLRGVYVLPPMVMRAAVVHSASLRVPEDLPSCLQSCEGLGVSAFVRMQRAGCIPVGLEEDLGRAAHYSIHWAMGRGIVLPGACAVKVQMLCKQICKYVPDEFVLGSPQKAPPAADTHSWRYLSVR